MAAVWLESWRRICMVGLRLFCGRFWLWCWLAQHTGCGSFGDSIGDVLRSCSRRICSLHLMRFNLPRLLLSVWIPTAGLYLAARSLAQEPSASLKQADADYREGVAALNRNDLKTAQA